MSETISLGTKIRTPSLTLSVRTYPEYVWMIAKLKVSSQLEKDVSSKLLDISRAHLHYRIRRLKGSLTQKQRILLWLSVVSWYNTRRYTRFHSTVSCLCVKHTKSETSRFARTSVLLTITSTCGHCGSSRGQSTGGLSLDITPGPTRTLTFTDCVLGASW